MPTVCECVVVLFRLLATHCGSSLCMVDAGTQMSRFSSQLLHLCTLAGPYNLVDVSGLDFLNFVPTVRGGSGV